MENTENKDVNTETKSVNDTVAEILKTEVKSLEEKLRTEITAEVKNFYNQLPVIGKDETIEIKKDKKELNKGFSEFLSKAMTTSTEAVLLPQDYRDIILGTNLYGTLEKDGYITTTKSTVMRVPVTTDLPTVYTLGESDGTSNGVTGSKPITKDLQITLKRNMCNIQATVEFISGHDDLLGYFENVVPEAFGFKEDYNLWNATDGIYTNASSSFVQMTNSGSLASALTYKDLTNMEAAIPKRYRKNAKWYIDNQSMGVVRGLVSSGSTGIPLFSTTDGVEKLLGYPVEIIDAGVQNLPTVTTSNTPYFSFGDMSSVWLGRNGDMTLLVDNFTNAKYGLVDYYFTRMENFGMSNPKALVTIKNR